MEGGRVKEKTNFLAPILSPSHWDPCSRFLFAVKDLEDPSDNLFDFSPWKPPRRRDEPAQ